jgi:hypothetical protein
VFSAWTHVKLVLETNKLKQCLMLETLAAHNCGSLSTNRAGDCTLLLRIIRKSGIQKLRRFGFVRLAGFLLKALLLYALGARIACSIFIMNGEYMRNCYRSNRTSTKCHNAHRAMDGSQEFNKEKRLDRWMEQDCIFHEFHVEKHQRMTTRL